MMLIHNGISYKSEDKIYKEVVIPKVRKMVRKYFYNINHLEEEEEAFGYVMLRLVPYIRKFNPNRKGANFEAYYIPRVKGAILDYIRATTPWSRKFRRIMVEICSLNKKVRDKEGTKELIEFIEDENLDNYFEDKNYANYLWNKLFPSILSEEDVYVLYSYYVEGKTQVEIGDVINVTSSQVCNIIHRSLRRIKKFAIENKNIKKELLR